MPVIGDSASLAKHTGVFKPTPSLPEIGTQGALATGGVLHHANQLGEVTWSWERPNVGVIGPPAVRLRWGRVGVQSASAIY